MYRICSRKYDRRWLGNAPDTYQKAIGGDVMLEGTFVLLPYMKKSCTTFFLLIVTFICIAFFSGRFIDFNRMSDFIYVSIISAV